MRQGISDWPSRVWRRVRITSTIALKVVKNDGMGTQCWGYDWATLFLGDINTRTWAPGWGSLESETVKYGHESCGTRTWEWIYWRGPAGVVNDQPILSLERMLRKDNSRGVQLENKYLAVSLKGLGVKTIWFAVNRQSLSNSDSDSSHRLPCGGGVEYLHRSPASRRRRRNVKSQIWDSKIFWRIYCMQEL
jgi:hypothetical protein